MVQHRPRFSATALVALSLGIIALLTLIPMPWQAAAVSRSPWYCLVCGDEGAVDVLQNIALFAPFGLALGLRGVRPSRALLTGFLISATIELLQATVVTGRDASLSDVITNSLGTLIGALIAVAGSTLWHPPLPLARKLALLCALGWLVLPVGTALLVRPDAAAGPVHLVAAPADPPLQQFQGVIHSARVDTAPGRGIHIRLSAAVSTSGRTDQLAPALELQDDNPTPLALLGVIGQKAIFSHRMLATRLRFRTPSPRIHAHAIPIDYGPALLQGGLDGSTLWVAVTADGRRYEDSIQLTPGAGWMLMLPFRSPFDRHQHLAAALWLAAPLVLAGFCAGRARLRLAIVLAAAVVVLAVGLEGTALLFHLARDGKLAWIAGLLAVWGSWEIGLGIRRPRARGAASP